MNATHMNAITETNALILTGALQQIAATAASQIMEAAGLPELENFLRDRSEAVSYLEKGMCDLQSDMESTTSKVEELEGTLSECVSESDLEREIVSAIEHYDFSDVLRNTDITQNIEDHERRIDELESSVEGTGEWISVTDDRLVALEIKAGISNETLQKRVDLLEAQLSNVLELMASIRAVSILVNKF